MKKHRILSLLLAAIMLIPANVTALAYDRTSKEPPSSTERVEQLRNSGLESLESADPIDPLEEITAINHQCVSVLTKAVGAFEKADISFTGCPIVCGVDVGMEIRGEINLQMFFSHSVTPASISCGSLRRSTQ